MGMGEEKGEARKGGEEGEVNEYNSDRLLPIKFV